MAAYYNENDPKAAEWLRQLIRLGAIAPGDVDERSIVDVSPIDLEPYDQCHFFAGIGTWSYALRQAGWEDDRPVWTASPPCQPFSLAGKRKGSDDERDLWWALFWHICQCQPAIVIGEQVASKDGLGWWDTVAADLEGEDYAATAFDLCAASVGAPHIRQRLYWVGVRQLGDSQEQRSASCFRQNASVSRERFSQVLQPKRFGDSDRTPIQLVYPLSAGLEISPSNGGTSPETGNGNQGAPTERASTPLAGFWSDAQWLLCRDDKLRAARPGTFPLVQRGSAKPRSQPLANGLTSDLVRGGDIGIQTEDTDEARVMRLKGYGNAIVAPLATAFVECVMEELF